MTSCVSMTTYFSVEFCGMFLCTTLLSGGALRRQFAPPHRRSWSSPYMNPSFPQRHAAFDAQRWRAFAGWLFFAGGTRQSMHHVRNAACAMSPPTPLWLYRICRGDGGDLEEGPPLLGDPVGHRRQVLDAVSNGSHKRSPWLHWTLCRRVAAKHRERGRDQYGDKNNFTVRIHLRDPRTTEQLGRMEMIRLDNDREANAFMEDFSLDIGIPDFDTPLSSSYGSGCTLDGGGGVRSAAVARWLAESRAES